MLVNNFTDIMKNIHTLEKYRKSGNPREFQFYKDIIGKGKVFVVVEINGRYYFAPSRFVGYSENNKEKHESNPDKDGRDTNPEIDRVLGKHEINSNMEDEFLKFCEQNDIEPDNNERKYWKVSLILNSSSNLIF